MSCELHKHGLESFDPYSSVSHTFRTHQNGIISSWLFILDGVRCFNVKIFRKQLLRENFPFSKYEIVLSLHKQ